MLVVLVADQKGTINSSTFCGAGANSQPADVLYSFGVELEEYSRMQLVFKCIVMALHILKCGIFHDELSSIHCGDRKSVV